MKGSKIRNLPFPELGKIYPNRKSIRGNHFDFDIMEEEEELKDYIESRYSSNHSDKITVMLPFQYPCDNFESTYMARQNNMTIAISDGEIIRYWLDPETLEPLVMNGFAISTRNDLNLIKGTPVSHRDVLGIDEEGQPIRLLPYSRLMVMLPELKRIAYMSLTLTDLRDQLSIREEINNIYNSTWNDIRKIPIEIYFGLNYFNTCHGIRKRTALTATVPEYFDDDSFDRNIFCEHEELTKRDGVGKI